MSLPRRLSPQMGCRSPEMPPRVSELKLASVAEAKLAARGISANEALSVLRNGPVFARNPRAGESGRMFLVGRTDGGRPLTIVIEPTLDSTTWLIVTAWDSGPRERKLQS